jgi:sugar lactone lactonase YvrE
MQAAVALAAVGVFIFAATRAGESTQKTPAPETAAGRVAATIPLGAQPTSVAVDGDLLWVGTTAGTLIRVDAVTNKVVGAPVEVAGAVANSIVRAGEGAVFLVAGDRLYRIDPTSGEVTARRRIDGQALGATLAGGQLWVTRRAAPQSGDHLATVQHFDAQTLAPAGLAVQTEDLPQDVDVTGATAWVANSGAGSVTRVDTDRGTSISSSVGGLPVAGVILGGKYWVTDFAGGYVTEIDAASGRHDGIVRVPGAVSIVAGDGGTLWVTSVPGEGRDAPARLVRLDPTARRVVGAPVQLGSDVGSPAFARGSVWVGSRSKSALLRIEPTSPAPAASPGPSVPTDTLSSGPLSAGTKRSGQFALPFDLTLKDDGWLGILARDNYAAVSRTTPTHAAVGLVLPDLSMGANGSASKISSAGRLVRDLSRDPRLTVRPLAATSVGGTPAIGLEVSARADAPAAPNYCDHVCVPVLAAGKLTITVDAGVQQELRIFERHGRVVVASLTAPAGSPELARMRATLATLRFR